MADVLEPPEEWQVVFPAGEGQMDPDAASEQSDEEAEPPAPDAVASPWSNSLVDLVADMRLEHEERRAPPSPSPYSPFQLGEHMVGWPAVTPRASGRHTLRRLRVRRVEPQASGRRL